MKNLVPIKIKIEKDIKDGNVVARYPDFGTINGVNWSVYFNSFGIGIHYDKVDNIGNGAEYEYIVTAVPKSFAITAVEKFPLLVSIITEEELEDFYDHKSHVYDPTELIDDRAIQMIYYRVFLEDKGVISSPDIKTKNDRVKALDPNDPTPGIRKNVKKTWKDFKNAFGINIIR